MVVKRCLHATSAATEVFVHEICLAHETFESVELNNCNISILYLSRLKTVSVRRYLKDRNALPARDFRDDFRCYVAELVSLYQLGRVPSVATRFQRFIT